jgi:hypothetical protein
MNYVLNLGVPLRLLEAQLLHVSLEEGYTMAQYTAVFHCPTALRFEQGDQFGPVIYNTSSGVLEVSFGTSYRNIHGLERPFPYELFAEVHGTATSLPEAMEYFSGIVLSLTPFFAVSTNAATGRLDLDLVYESTPGVTQRAFFQRRVSWDDSLPRETRQVPKAATRALMTAVDQNPEKDRFLRAVEHYSLALEHWQPGREISILSHLWMCAETLTYVAAMRRCQDSGLPTTKVGRKQLAAKLGFENLNKFDAQIRLEDIFRNDETVYNAAKDGRHALVHGFEDFESIRDQVRGICEPTAAYLRSAIFRLNNLDVDMQQSLLEAPYSTPLGNWPLEQHVMGKLNGAGDALAPQNWPHPYLTWTIDFQVASETNPHDYPYACKFNITPHLAENITFDASDNDLRVYSPNKLQVD